MFSVVVPTHNRAESACRLARALDSRECVTPFEVTFVLDGCTDGTRAALEELGLNAGLNIVETPASGAGAARNKGVASSSGEYLLFIDDDIMPQPGMLTAHVRNHLSASGVAVVGPYPYAPEMPVGPLNFMIRDWWHRRFQALADPTHRFTYRDCLTGNFSLPRDAFEAVGGFDEGFRKDGREDYEFGCRLLKSGVRMRFAADALAYHYPAGTAKLLLKKWHTFGRADVRFAQKHPEVFWSLPIRRYARVDRLSHAPAALASIAPERIVNLLGAYFERKPDKLWDPRMLGVFYRARAFCYWLGLIAALGGVKQLHAFIAQWQDSDEMPAARTRVDEFDVFAGPFEAPATDEFDKVFLVSRAGKSVAGWVDYANDGGQDCVPSRDVSKRVCRQAGMDLWRTAAALNQSSASPYQIDYAAREDLKKWIASGSKELANALRIVPSEAEEPAGISPLIFSEDGATPDTRSSSEMEGVRLRDFEGGLNEALSVSFSELVVLLSESDEPDPGWRRAVAAHFSDPSVSCVITPAVRRKVECIGDELYCALLDFERVRHWRGCCLTDGFHPAYVLSEFNMACHRLVLRRRTLESLVGQLESVGGRCAETSAEILSSLLANYERVIFEPRALVWTRSRVSADEVKRMALAHTALVYGMVSQRLLGNAGKVRAAKTLARLTTLMGKRVVDCAGGRRNWPLSFALAEAVTAVRSISPRGSRRQVEVSAS
jgi:GT2 family glycosyltransferase